MRKHNKYRCIINGICNRYGHLQLTIPHRKLLGRPGQGSVRGKRSFNFSGQPHQAGSRGSSDDSSCDI